MHIAWPEVMVGAAVMFVLDPSVGPSRRAAFRSGVGRILHWTAHSSSRGVACLPVIGSRWNRARTLSDVELMDRIRTCTEQDVSQPEAIDVQVESQQVTLSGPILAREVVGLLRHVARLPGVLVVNNHLRPQRLPGTNGKRRRLRPANVTVPRDVS